MKYLILFLAACAPVQVIQYEGIPRDAAATSWCDGQDGRVRSALDARLFRVDSTGAVEHAPMVPEVLVHEAVHRQQIERRRAEGICHKPYGVTELMRMEAEAYCASYRIALRLGRDSLEVASRYARAMLHQFREIAHSPMLLRAVWRQRCPRYGLTWDG